MALVPIYDPEAAAKLLWRLILTNRARIEDFDTPPPGYVGNRDTFRNLAREYDHLQKDAGVLADVKHYFDTINHVPERVEVVSPRDFTPPPDPAPPEPNVELDGVTLLTNADPTDLTDLPF